MSSATPMPYNVRYDANLGTIVYEFPTGWLPVPLGTESVSQIIGTGNPTVLKPLVDGIHAFAFTNAAGNTTILSIDSQDARVGIGTSTPSSLLTVNGNITASGTVTTESGLLLPAFTNATIATLPKTEGYMVYSSDDLNVQVANGTAFVPISGGSSSPNAVIVTNDTTDFFTTTSSTFVDSGFGVTITPSSSSAKILVTINFSNDMIGTGHGAATIFRGIGGTNLGGGSINALVVTAQNFGSMPFPVSMSFLDSPNTTSPVTYEVYVASLDGTSTFRMNDDGLRMVAIAQEIH